MKIRSGFVSNSSSSSFCILGKSVTSEEQDLVDVVKSSILKTKNSISYEGDKYAGACPSSMLEDETLAQFKKRIVAELTAAKIPTTVSELEWIIDGGYNG